MTLALLLVDSKGIEPSTLRSPKRSAKRAFLPGGRTIWGDMPGYGLFVPPIMSKLPVGIIMPVIMWVIKKVLD